MTNKINKRITIKNIGIRNSQNKKNFHSLLSFVILLKSYFVSKLSFDRPTVTHYVRYGFTGTHIPYLHSCCSYYYCNTRLHF